jgi:hypothetical protein
MAIFCSSLISWIPGTLLRYFLNDFEMVPVAPINTGITIVFTFHLLLLLLLLLSLLMYWENLREGNHLEDRGVGGTIMLTGY